MELEIITIGDELLLGQTVDTNASEISKAFASVGVRVVRRSTVGDDPDLIAASVSEALKRADIVVTSGGLGPTSDDRTRGAVAGLLGRELEFDADYFEEMRRRFESWGIGNMPASNRSQAERPAGSEFLVNRKGSAPGIWIEEGDGVVVMLPGVPHELTTILSEELLPKVIARFSGPERATMSRILRTTGISESALADLIEPVTGEFEAALAFLPGYEGVDLRLTVWNELPERITERMDRDEARLRSLLGHRIYGSDRDDLAALLQDELRLRHQTLAVAESCTGGMIAQRLTKNPGSSATFLGGIVSYSNQSKLRDLGVSAETLAAHGAVSEAVAREMVAGVRQRFGCDAAIAVTGVAGPDGGTSEKPVGTVYIAAQLDDEMVVSHRVMPGDRDWIRLRTSQEALNRLRLLLMPNSARKA